MSIPSASFCQRSTILLSSSSATLEHKEKNGPELSPKQDSPFDGCFSADLVGSTIPLPSSSAALG